MATTKPKFTRKPWRQIVEEVEPGRRNEPTPAYIFTNGRRFHHKRNPYT